MVNRAAAAKGMAARTGNPARENPYPPEEPPLPRCPNCGAALDVDAEVYYQGGEPVGCACCTDCDTAERLFVQGA